MGARNKITHVPPHNPQNSRPPLSRETARREADSVPPSILAPPAASLHLLAGVAAAITEGKSNWLWDLRNQFPGWRVWEDPDDGQWHARRKGNFFQAREPGAPVYALHAGDHERLGELLAAEDRVPVPASARLP